MKKKAYFLAGLFLLILCMSCSMPAEDDALRLEELRERYAVIGEAHNRALDAVLAEFALQEAPASKSARMAQADDVLNGLCIPGWDVPLSTDREKDLAAKIVSALRPAGLLSKTSVNADVVEDLSDSLSIIREHRDIFDSISVILDAPAGQDEKIRRLEALYLYIDACVMPEEDKLSLMHGLSTILHSLAYWDENMDTWESTVSAGMGKPAMGIVGAIGIIDGVGAVIGTLEGFRDTKPGEDGRAMTIAGRAVGEAAKTSVYAVLAIILL